MTKSSPVVLIAGERPMHTYIRSDNSSNDNGLASVDNHTKLDKLYESDSLISLFDRVIFS